MKRVLIFILLLLAGCAARPKSLNTTRFVMGNLTLEAANLGGAYVQAIDKKTNLKTITKLDDVNSFTIENSTYDMLFVVFSGPDANTGTMMCGTLPDIVISAETTLTVNITQANCTQSMFAQFILELKKSTTSIWDSDRWDLSYWGP